MIKYIIQITKSCRGCGVPVASLEAENLIEARQKFFNQVKRYKDLIKRVIDCDKIIVTVAKKDEIANFLEYEEIEKCQQ